jgi:hypothetical protein
MLIGAAYYIRRHGPPKAAIVGLIWDSLASDYYFRASCKQLLEDADFSTELLLDVEKLGGGGVLANALAAQIRAAASDHDQKKSLPIGERLDSAVTEWVAPRVPLLANLSLQAALRHDTFERLMRFLSHGGATNVREVTRAKLDFNLQAMLLMADYLRSKGITLLTYRVPERTDVLGVTSRTEEEAVMGALSRDLEARGAVVLDLRHVVPNEFWGWAGDSPDRAHFMPPGHRLLAEALLREGRARGAFRELEAVR